MPDKLPTNFFANNRQQLLKSVEQEAIVITANGLMQKSADQAYEFQQDSNFWYLTGLSEPDLILVITNKLQFLIIPDYYIRRQQAMAAVDKSALRKLSGVDEVFIAKEGWLKLKALLKTKARLATLLPNATRLKGYGIYTNPARRELVTKLKRLNPNWQIEDIRLNLARMRMAKQPAEIELITKALNITIATLTDILNPVQLNQYHDTAEIEQALRHGFESRGAPKYSFEPVIALGPDAAYIHYDSLGVPLKLNQLMVCDVGCVYRQYCSDITRTVSIGQPTARQREVFEAVKYIQMEAYKLLKAGMNYFDYEQQVTNILGQQLIQLGLIKTLDQKAIRRYYPTYCSHSLGLDPHDSADYHQPLPVDMVMTVEPGIYIQDEGIGVRLEDVVRLTTAGYELLTSKLSITI